MLKKYSLQFNLAIISLLLTLLFYCKLEQLGLFELCLFVLLVFFHLLDSCNRLLFRLRLISLTFLFFTLLILNKRIFGYEKIFLVLSIALLISLLVFAFIRLAGISAQHIPKTILLKLLPHLVYGTIVVVLASLFMFQRMRNDQLVEEEKSSQLLIIKMKTEEEYSRRRLVELEEKNIYTLGKYTEMLKKCEMSKSKELNP